LKCAFHFITWGSGQNNEREGKKEIEKEGKVFVKKKKKKVYEVEKGKVRSATAEERRKKEHKPLQIYFMYINNFFSSLLVALVVGGCLSPRICWAYPKTGLLEYQSGEQ
jgi:hypothetical protein